MANWIARNYHRATSTPHFVRLLTSWCLPPLALASIRALFALYIFTVLFIGIGFLAAETDKQYVAEFFSYFTILTYWGLGFYFAVSAAHGFIYATRGPCGLAAGPMDDLAVTPETMGGLKRGLRLAHSAYFATITVFPFVVTAVFWGVLAEYALVSRFSAWENISEHAMNSAFAFFELVITRSDPNPWIHILVIVILLALYLSLSFVSEAIHHVYVYPFLNIQLKGSAFVAIAIILILVGACIFFGIVRVLMYLRKRITERSMQMTGKLSQHDTRPSSSDYKEPHVQVSEMQQA